MHPFSVFVMVFIASDLPIFISSAPRFQEGDIRLLGGRTRYEGTVLIYHNGEWGSICDRSWGRRDANVACRQLGYTRAMQSARGSRYGIGRNRRWMTRLRCRGSERRLDKCHFGEWGIRNDLRYCSARRRSAGVRCYPTRMTRRRRPVTRAPRRRPVTSTPRPVTVRSTLKSTTITSTRPTTTPTTTTQKDKTTTNSSRRIVKTTKTPNEIPKSIISSTRRPVTSTPRPVIVRSTLKPVTIPSTRPPPKYRTTTENDKATTSIYRGIVQTIKTTPAEIVNNIISSVVDAPAPQGPPVLTGSLADPDPPGPPGQPGPPGTNEDILNNNIPSPQQPYSFISSSSSRSSTDVEQTLSPLSNHIQVLGTNSSNDGRREHNINTTLIHIAENNNIVVDLPETGTTPLTVSDTITPFPVETPDEKNDINNSPVQRLTTTENISPETEMRESSSATSETTPSHLNITLSPSTSIRTTVSFLATTSSPRNETTTEKTTPSTSNGNVNGQNPDLVQNKWIKDKLLNAFVFLSRRGKILVSKDGGRPEQMTIAQYINKRREVILSTLNDINDIQSDSNSNNEGSNAMNDDQDRISGDIESIVYIDTGNEEGKVGIRLMGGRHSMDGRVEVLPPGGGRWGVICADTWTMKEAIVACRHLRKSYAQQPIKMDHYGGSDQMKHYSSVKCSGREKSLQDCKWREHDGPVTCSRPESVAGVVCTRALPDLEPDIYMLETSVSLQDRHLYYLQCAMEEKCLAPSAYRVQGSRGWRHATRRLMRFSSVVKNIGTADFKPISDRSQWEWHACHMHYHSMEVFAHYDILDNNGNRVAEGLKASFCLEDSACNPGIYPKYSCQNYGQQGISVGCSDNYMSDIDCQWIDITDLKPGKYTFKLEINPNLYVAETSFENNVIVCDLTYTGYYARIFNCNLKSLL